MSVVLHRCLFAPSSFECFLELLMTLVGFLFFASEVCCCHSCLCLLLVYAVLLLFPLFMCAHIVLLVSLRGVSKSDK
jgi:hypothetical protein